MITTRRARPTLAALGLSVVLLSCQPRDTVTERYVESWLTCIECYEGELGAVVVAAATNEDLVVSLLAAAARNGPSDERRDNLQHQFQAIL